MITSVYARLCNSRSFVYVFIDQCTCNGVSSPICDTPYCMRIHIREPIVFLHFHVWLTEGERDVIAFLLETTNVFISSEFLISCFLDQCAFTCNTVSLEMPRPMRSLHVING